MNLGQIRCLVIKQSESKVSTLAYNPLLCLLPQDCLPLLAKKRQEFHRVPYFFWHVNLRLRVATFRIAVFHGLVLVGFHGVRCLRSFVAVQLGGSRLSAACHIRSVECSRCLIIEPGPGGWQVSKSTNKHSKYGKTFYRTKQKAYSMIVKHEVCCWEMYPIEKQKAFHEPQIHLL